MVQLHSYAWWRAEGDGVDEGLFYAPTAESQLTVFSQVGAEHRRCMLHAMCVGWGPRLHAT